MTDALAERFATLANRTDDSDWLDVRRRARRRRARLVAPAALIAAAVVAATALAASSHWVFSTHDRQVTAETNVTLGSRTWRVSYSTMAGHAAKFCASATSAGITRSRCRATGTSSPSVGPAFGALRLDVPGGQIWTGAAVGFAQRIAVTDASGRVHTAQAVRAPRGTKTPLHYWAIGLDATTAVSITAYDARGRSIRKTVNG